MPSLRNRDAQSRADGCWPPFPASAALQNLHHSLAKRPPVLRLGLSLAHSAHICEINHDHHHHNHHYRR
eukprot:5769075-Karenia_brevis.AAC.1